MAYDTVDALHDAEDALGALRLALEAVVDHAKANPAAFADAPEVLTTVRTALIIGESYCRCEWDEDEEEYMCSEVCGCPADHEHPHGEEQLNAV